MDRFTGFLAAGSTRCSRTGSGHSHGSKPEGFTLVELVVTVAILGILSAVAIPQYLGVMDRSDRKAKVAETVAVAKECAALNAGGPAGRQVALVNPFRGYNTPFQTCGGTTPRGFQFFISERFNSPGPVTCMGEAFANARGVLIFVMNDRNTQRHFRTRLLCRAS
ncbi:type IV pilin protein [Synechococcus sp. RSCCF101]|uniref:type IV pilin protein n=1 Tax=Synechococcus sp. RSCCF101 TaxID=2511069 RepID=UPI00177FADA2|nr:prepilin-type N-terminal cleavage/methylation domain-containing protein [Synechococcus sp. RSCCF101]